MEGATPSEISTSQTYEETNQAKRQRVNPVSKEEYTEETAEVTSTKRDASRHATPFGGTLEPSTSHTQMLER